MNKWDSMFGFEKHFGHHKDLKIGDKVRYEGVERMGKEPNGKGTVIGFGKFDQTTYVWIEKEDGEITSAPYEKVSKQ